MSFVIPVISSNLEVNNFSRDYLQAQRLNGQGTGKTTAVSLTRPLSAITIGPDGFYTYVAASQPRFGWDPVTLQPRGIYIGNTGVPNVLDYSEDFSQSYWEKNNVTAILNTTFVSPSGNFSSYEINEGFSTTKHALSSPAVFQTNTAYPNFYTVSIFARPGTCDLLQLILDSDTGGFATNRWVTFNLTTGTISNNPASLEAYIIPAGRGWFKLMVVSPSLATGINTGVQYAMCTTATANTKSPTYAGTGRNIYLWGAHYFRGNTQEYTPTYGLSSNPGAGLAYNTGLLDFTGFSQFDSTIYQNSSAGTLYLEYIQHGRQPGAIDTIFTFGANNAANTIGFRSTDGVLNIAGHLRSNSTLLYGPFTSINAFQVTKAAFAWQVGSQGCAVNGTLLTPGTATQVVVDTTGNKPTGYYIGSFFGSGLRNGWYRKLRYYPYRLPNQVLIGMTK